MSSDSYAGRLSKYNNKGVCGLPEQEETKRSLDSKINKLLSLIETSKHIVVLTGAGISTGAGIPDFRGPSGIWTLENEEKKIKKRKQKSKSMSIQRRKLNQTKDEGTKSDKCEVSEKNLPSFSAAKPTLTHRALTYLTKPPVSRIKYTITQNVDGLHARSGMPRSNHCFLHGCIFTEKCEDCGKEYFRDFDTGGLSFQKTGRFCDSQFFEKDRDGKSIGKGPCGGCLRDTLLDWEDELPEDDWILAQEECAKSDLVLALGTSLRIEPAGSLPTLGERFVIINKQTTPYDHHAKVALTIKADVEVVFKRIMESLEDVEEAWDRDNRIDS